MLLLLAACVGSATVDRPERPERPGDSDTAPGEDTGDSPPRDTAVEVLPGDSRPPDTGPDPDGLDLYTPSVIWELALDISTESWKSLSQDGHDYAPVTLRWEDEAFEVEVHIKGSSSWQSIDGKPSLVVDVNRTVPDQEFMGAKKFNLHNDWYDPSGMSETLSYRFYREWGYPAARTAFAHLTVNGDDYGLYTVVENHDHDFLERWFADPDGNLYENEEAYCDVDDLTCMEPKQVGEANDDALVRLGKAARAGDDTWESEVRAVLDWDAFVAYTALEMTIVHWDSYSYDQSNYRLYHEPTVDRFTMLTQSMDLDYGYRPWSYPNCGQYAMDMDDWDMGMLAASCERNETCHTDVVDAMEQYADLLEAADGAARVRELDALIGDTLRADPKRHDGGQYATHVACLQDFFAKRPEQIRTWVASQRE